jgi:hypothetical protein
MTQTSASHTAADSTEVRFSIQSLLLITVPVAVVATVAGQGIRKLEPVQQGQAVIAWGGWLLLVIGWLTLIASKRVHVEKLAGRTIMRLPIYGMNPIWRVISRYMFSAYLILIVPQTLIVIAERAARAGSLPSALLTAVYPDSVFLAWLAASCIVLWWWPQNIRLCENGLLWDRRFIRWADARERWDPDYDAVTVYGPNQDGGEVRFDMIVPERQRGAVEAFLEEKMREKRNLNSNEKQKLHRCKLFG